MGKFMETDTSVSTTPQEVIKQYTSQIKGLKAKCGVIVTGISNHAAERIVERNITLDELVDLITNAPLSYPSNKPDSTCQQKGNLRLVLGNTNGKIVSIIERQ